MDSMVQWILEWEKNDANTLFLANALAVYAERRYDPQWDTETSHNRIAQELAAPNSVKDDIRKELERFGL